MKYSKPRAVDYYKGEYTNHDTGDYHYPLRESLLTSQNNEMTDRV
jgi:hypothetical protein